MNPFFFFVLWIPFLINPIYSLHPIKPKLCIDCEFFKPNFLSGNKFGKCISFPTSKEEYSDYFLVDGKKEKKEKDYLYCSTARKFENLCGKEGKNYVEKTNTNFFWEKLCIFINC